jgi:hypothetical protein
MAQMPGPAGATADPTALAGLLSKVGAGAAPPPPGAPPQGAAPAAPPAQAATALPPIQFHNLDDTEPPHLQLLDLAITVIDSALQTGGFFKTPKLFALVKWVRNTLAKALAASKTGRSVAAESPPSGEGAINPPADSEQVGDEDIDPSELGQ